MGTMQLRALAEQIARGEAEHLRVVVEGHLREGGRVVSDEAVDMAVLLSCAYPALARSIAVHPEELTPLTRGGTKLARDVRTYRRLALTVLGDALDHETVRRELRRFASREKLRIAARELLSLAGADLDVTARELSDLADVCTDIALDEALAWAEARFGRPQTLSGERCPFVVIGMGKLGGRELNAGSDIDLLLFYETDEGVVVKDGKVTEQTLHEHFMRVAQRFVATLDDVTEDGMVWRVDLRLRPEGARGPLVNALAAAERYYETWGRTWERAAMLRARPIAGDIAFGTQALSALTPFVWRREVNPGIAEEMWSLVMRARAELGVDIERDLKHGTGGIREAEFFVQSLQLIWGGREPVVRATNTLDALRRLRARGLVTDREGREVADAYLTLRRLEHRIQFATGLQTHSLPEDPHLLTRIARSLGFAGTQEMLRDLDKVRRKVVARFASLRPRRGGGELGDDELVPYEKLFVALDDRDEPAVAAWLPSHFGAAASPDLARHLIALARRPDFPLGAASRDRLPQLAPVILEALADAADPEQATRLMAAFFARLMTPSVYARALADDLRAARRLASLFGASVFLGQSMVSRPELADRLLFGRGVPTSTSVRQQVGEEVAAIARTPGPDGESPSHARDDADELVGALRRAKAQVTMQVGLSDLAGDLSTRDCTITLSALADAVLEHAVRFAAAERGFRADAGLAVLAMGKLGGREVGYGSDLDIFFVYDDGNDPDAGERYVRTAQRVLRLLSAPHGDGPGYELDTRLRPSGNQGLLVVSLESFARYHGVRGVPGVDIASDLPGQAHAQDWERQALLKARACAGDAALGAKVIAIATAAAYEREAPPPDRVHHSRMRMERELAGERVGRDGRARYDLKLGHGGLVDVEFAVQWLQMRYGGDPRVRTTETEVALGALEACGYLEPTLAASLRDGYRFLRRLEQRLRVLHGTSAHLIEEGAGGLALLARRMGMRDGPRGVATEALLTRYLSVTRDVRAAYLAVLGQPAG